MTFLAREYDLAVRPNCKDVGLFGPFLCLAFLAGSTGCARRPALNQLRKTTPRSAYTGVLTCHNDNTRTGQNLAEMILTPANVNSRDFGKLHSYPVDGLVYAQPLYVKDVNIRGSGLRNVVFVVTEHDTVYAFDADGRSPESLWRRSLTRPIAGITPVAASSFRHGAIANTMGITGTPVIDPSTGILYVVSLTNEKGNIVYRLHALDITTGAERVEGGVIIRASVPGKGVGNDGEGHVVFDPAQQLQRPGLLLSKCVVYVAFGSYWDTDPYHGWLLGYNARTLMQVSVFCTTPNGSEGSIWQAGAAPAADSHGNIFVATANGTFDAGRGGNDYGESVLKLLHGSGELRVSDYFTPSNWAFLNKEDLDLGSGGVMLLPAQPPPAVHLLMVGSKGSVIYLVNRDNMGRFDPRRNRIAQALPLAARGIECTPAYWHGYVYIQEADDRLRAFRLQNGRLSLSSRSRVYKAYGGATPAVSADGSSNAVVWLVDADPRNPHSRAVLRAFDATNVTDELYDSTQAGARDLPGLLLGGRWPVPTVFNGKVYVAAGKELDVYGLLATDRKPRNSSHTSKRLQ